MLAELDPKPDQVTIAINTNQMNVMELITEEDVAGTSLGEPDYRPPTREMYHEGGPGFVEEHLKRLLAAGIQPHFMLGRSTAARNRRADRSAAGQYTGPLRPQLGRPSAAAMTARTRAT